MRNQNEERIVRRQTTWYVINIKAFKDCNLSLLNDLSETYLSLKNIKIFVVWNWFFV